MKDFEVLRRAHRPREIRVLFVGESRPAGGTFFYAGDSILHDAMRDAFCSVFPAIQRGQFLRTFADLGCYLEDLCSEPVNKLKLDDLRRIEARVSGESLLASRLAGSAPRAVVVVMKAIVPNVRRVMEAAGLSQVDWCDLPFPRPEHRGQFVDELVAGLRSFAKAGYLADDGPRSHMGR